jgi:alpha-glucosidase
MARAMRLNPAKVDRVPFDITDPKYMDAYFRILHHPEEQSGVDFWWMDWQQGQSTKMPGLDTLPWINHLHWRDMERNPRRGDARPLIFSRFGGIGAGRYCVGFSGDTHSVWESLQFQPYFTATAANVLYGYWSHDIGGHMPGEIEPELYTRWIQFGVHSPVLRTHTTKNPKAERRVWEYPEPYSGIMVDALRKRYELVPYIYAESRKSCESGLSLCRPMYYEHPEEAAAYAARDQYWFGSQMIVAPVLTRASTRDEMAAVKVWLPEGRWFDTARGAFETGGRVIRRRYLVSECPVFVRPGAIIPGQRPPTRLRPGSYPELVITAYPGGDGEYRLYEDDGISRAYTRDRCAWLPLAQKCTRSGRTLTIGPAEGRFDGFLTKRPVEVRLPGAVPPGRVSVGGKVLPWSLRPTDGCWSYDGDNATVIIRLAAVNLARGTVLTVVENRAAAPLADGLKGLMARLARVSYYNTISTAGCILHPQERLGVDAAQTGNRITRRPGSFREEVRALRGKVEALPAMLTALGRGRDPWAGHKRSPERAARCRIAIAILRSAVRPESA